MLGLGLGLGLSGLDYITAYGLPDSKYVCMHVLVYLLLSISQ